MFSARCSCLVGCRTNPKKGDLQVVHFSWRGLLLACKGIHLLEALIALDGQRHLRLRRAQANAATLGGILELAMLGTCIVHK